MVQLQTFEEVNFDNIFGWSILENYRPPLQNPRKKL